MGGAVGGAFAENGFTVITTLDGRSGPTCERALASGFQDGGSLADVVAAADILLSIVPPEYALAQAKATAAAMTETGKIPPYADCNAVAPETAVRIGQIIADAGADCIDGGIIGSPPGGNSRPTRFFVSGPGAAAMGAYISRDCGATCGARYLGRRRLPPRPPGRLLSPQDRS